MITCLFICQVQNLSYYGFYFHNYSFIVKCIFTLLANMFSHLWNIYSFHLLVRFLIYFFLICRSVTVFCFLFCFDLETELRVSHMLSVRCTTELHPLALDNRFLTKNGLKLDVIKFINLFFRNFQRFALQYLSLV